MPLLSNRRYDVAKWVALVALPALATFYAAIGSIWGLPHVTEIVATITAVDALLGALLGLSSAQHHKAEEIAAFEAEANAPGVSTARPVDGLAPVGLIEDPEALAAAEIEARTLPRREGILLYDDAEIPQTTYKTQEV